LRAKAIPTPAVVTSSPATGARAIWESTAAVQMPELAATISSWCTSDGSSDPAAGLKKADPADRPKAMA
jgi:hypothetical protein